MKRDRALWVLACLSMLLLLAPLVSAVERPIEPNPPPVPDLIRYTIRGYVVRMGTNQPLWYASVSLYKNGAVFVGTSTTSSSGYFSISFTSVKPAYVTMVVSCWGYHTYTRIINIGTGNIIGTGNTYLTSKLASAVVVGISDYEVGGDLHYADEDATDWCNILSSLGYDIRVLGDTHPENYPRWDGLATKANLRSHIDRMAYNAGPGDKLAITFACHGGPVEISNDDEGYVATWEGECTQYHDDEFYGDLLGTQASQVFVFMDTCRSGSFIDEFQDDTTGLGEKTFISTAVPWDGLAFDMYGIDHNTIPNGAWTHFFVTECIETPGDTVENCFDNAFSSFYHWYVDGPYNAGHVILWYDEQGIQTWIRVYWEWPPGSGEDPGPGVGLPQCFDGNTGVNFYL
ncbi:MAG: hypothetical protein EAX95_04040 [Candidatus Thorarchaeota archaeon]|nr:hypothetical protein [Candidatus Thorarchaeota archaeon]